MATELKRMIQRRDSTAGWAAFDPVLRDGELGLDVSLDRLKLGDGVSPWTNLPFLNLTLSDVQTVVTSLVNTTVPGLVTATLADQPAILEAAVALVEATVGIVLDSDNRLPQFLNEDTTDIVWGIADALSRVAIAIDSRGVFLPIAGMDLPGGTEVRERGILNPYLWAIADAANRVALAIDNQGLVVLPGGLTIGADSLQAVLTDQLLHGTVDSEGRIGEDALGPDGRVPGWVLAAWGDRVQADDWPFTVKAMTTTYHVKKDGTGDFTTIGAALAAATDGSDTKRYEVIIHPGVYAERSLAPGENVHIIGIDRDRCRVVGYLPASSTDDQLIPVSTFDLNRSGSMANLYVTCQNMRYAVHSEQAGGNPDVVYETDNCWFEHLGNQEVKDYRTANGLSPSAWTSWVGWGHGSASGQRFTHRNGTFLGHTGGGYYVHNIRDFTYPMVHHFIGCRINSNPITTLTLSSLGSGTNDQLIFEDCELGYDKINMGDNPWLTHDEAKQSSSHREIALTLIGGNPIAVVSDEVSKAIKIESQSTGAVSKVRVGGTAAPLIFGDGIARDGGGGLKGYIWGDWDISGIAVDYGTVTVSNTLGKRLGNCATTPKTLTVAVDGGAPITVTLNTDLTAASNAAVLAIINTALGSSAVASEYLPGPSGEFYANVPDRIRTLTNRSAYGIPRFAAVRHDTDDNGAALVGVGDPASSFVGIALEPIPPGQFGRVLVRGSVSTAQMYGWASGDLGYGEAVGLSPTTPGAFVKSSTRQIATGSYPNIARFEGAQ